MSPAISRKVFLVVAGGNASAQRHFEDTVQRKRTLEEVRRFLPSREIENLEKIYHGSNFIVWGAVPGPMNETRWEKMTPGDVVLIYNNGRIRFAGEIAAKVRNKDLARYFWNENDTGGTWEFMYFIVNEERTDVPIEKLNPLFGYQAHYRPQGFSMIQAELHFPGAVQIVDLYHARQHLWDLSAKIYPHDSPAQRRWVMVRKDKLDDGKIEALLRLLRPAAAAHPDLAEEIGAEINYFETNKERMRYPEFREQGLFVGSGVIEAGCKTVLGRLKRSGMFWTVRGANTIIALRCCELSGRFEDYWESRRALG